MRRRLLKKGIPFLQLFLPCRVFQRQLGGGPTLGDDRTQLVIDTYCSNLRNSGRPIVPSVSATGLVRTTIFASGAMAWMISTSSVVSAAQPALSLSGSEIGS